MSAHSAELNRLLFIVTQKGYLRIVLALLEHPGMDHGLARDNSCAPLDIAQCSGHIGIAQALMYRIACKPH